MSYNGSYDIITGLDAVVSNLTTEATACQTIAGVIASPMLNTVSEVDRQTGASQVLNQFNVCKNDIEGVSSIFTDGISIDTSSAYSATTSVTDKVEQILDSYENLENLTNTIIDKVENFPNAIENLGETVETYIDNATYKINNIVDNIQNFNAEKASQLPETIMNNCMGLSVVQDPLIAIMTIKDAATSVMTQIASMTAPTNISSIRQLLQKLKTIASAIDAAKSAVDRARQSIEKFAEQVKNGEVIGLLMQLMASGACAFFQQPMQYDTKYPENLSYTTIGGFVYEEDNTKGSERKSFHHPTGTGYYINPDGVAVFEGKADTQITTKKNLDVNCDENGTVTIGKDGRIVIQGQCDIEVKGNAKISAMGDTFVNSMQSVNINGTTNVNVSSTMDVNLTGMNVEVAALGLLTLSGTTGVNIVSRGGIGMSAGTATATPSIPVPGAIHGVCMTGVGFVANAGPIEMLAGTGFFMQTMAGPSTSIINGPIAVTGMGAQATVLVGKCTEMSMGKAILATTGLQAVATTIRLN